MAAKVDVGGVELGDYDNLWKPVYGFSSSTVHGMQTSKSATADTNMMIKTRIGVENHQCP